MGNSQNKKQLPSKFNQQQQQQSVQQQNYYQNNNDDDDEDQSEKKTPSQNQIFNDDEPISLHQEKETAKTQTDKEGKLQIQIKAQRSMIKLKEAIVLPAMCSIKTSGGSRTNVDLICVIDISGSMNGNKLNLVKQTMNFLIESLTENDRLSIIVFESKGYRICGLKRVSNENKDFLLTKVKDLRSTGGTNIMSGLDLALKTIRDRKMPNKATSIFLLSDGQDKGAENSFREALTKKQNQELGVYSIHSFGFGTDHDENLMTKICQMKDGSFYFIKQLATLDEAFCNALGGIISMVASEVIIKIRLVAKDIMQQVTIPKVYGEMWDQVSGKQYKIKLTQLMSGVSKDFVFQLSIPAINAEVGDLERNHDILDGIFTAKDVNGKELAGECSFKITLLNQNQEIPEINENVDVIENYLRVKAAAVIEQNMKKAEKHQYQQAQQGIDEMIYRIQSDKKARKDKMENLVTDLQLIRQKCSKQDYEVEGKKWMVSAKAAHSNQRNFQYANEMQCEMVTKRKADKKSKY